MAVGDWKLLAQKRRAQQAEEIPQEWRLKTIPKDFVDAPTVINNCGDLTCVDVTIAFCKRAAIAQQLIRCCTEMFFDLAIARAKQMDDYYARTGKTVGPLHGLPVSVKDSQDIKGIDTTLGWVGLIGIPAEKTALSVQILLSLGAIVYVKTNVPQSLMMSDSYNHVFGQSVNAFNKALISGGSSGGEGALVGCHGSLIGIGTDIGGSIRIPAVLQGLYGLCPSVGRVTNTESYKVQKYLVPPVAGPLTSNLSSLEFYMESIISSKPWEIDMGLLPINWRRDLAGIPRERLNVAFIIDDGIIHPQPPVERAVKEMMQKFKNAGHNVIEWDTSLHEEGYNLWLKCVLADGGSRFKRLCDLADEPLIQGMLVGTPADHLTAEQREEVHDNKTMFQQKYYMLWKQANVDAIIMPVLPWVNFRPKEWVQSNQRCCYTAIWNLLDYTSLTIPATHVDAVQDAPSAAWCNYKPRNESDEYNWKQYDVNLVAGMPVGLQIVTGRFGEEKAIGIAKLIKCFEQESNGH